MFFLSPGVIALFVRAQLLHGRLPTASDGVLAYFVLSIVYHAASLPLIAVTIGGAEALVERPWAWFALVVGGPALFGIVLGLCAQLGPVRWVLGCIGIDVTHPMPTAWDWKFSRRENCFVIVHLRDGRTFFGRLGEKSLISSNPKERDLYIQETFDLTEDNTWVSREDDGVLILHGDIRLIEFFKQKEAT